MKKICLLLALLMVLTVSCASAEAFVASPSVSDVCVTDIAAKDGTDMGTFFILVEKEDDENTAFYENIAEFVKTKPIVEYFDEAVFADAAELIPADVKLSDFQLNELLTLEQGGYENLIGDVDVAFSFPTEYQDGAVLLALIGVEGADGFTWTALHAEAVEGNVVVAFTQEVLSTMNGANIVLAVLEVR